ncbi:CUB and zona pellucida-like domain-containing protein 1 [Strongylocentrotus purpuratus]|uniref:ZP domain-containing protein n=1 Tax=Strongylocentrotus purpuratus TaxID=7668 RepID=A0A7M7LVU4_STRPU|nr:CUB and zona pellucida-like domain-containing protein 1 [Strongylocentrotus purpuratus]|eukprot:XP_011666905.1 PREDICTED: CUB and zona pellucida-like domain-containing protein 1 [Strongylocentrotus purpuratus]
MCQDKLTSVECGSSSMTVKIDEQLVLGNASGVHFRDQSCSGVNSSSTDITLSTGYDQCGTTFEEDNTTITFTNVITYAKPGSEDGTVITREYHMQVRVECCLKKEEIVSGSFRPQLGEVSFSDKGSGDFSLRLERFQTNAFGDLEVDPTSAVWQQDELFFAVGLESVPGVGMFIESCWATTTQDSDMAPQYSLISSGCPDDGTVDIYRLLGLNREGFSFKAFAFVGDKTEVYIHCSVKVCGTVEAQSFRDAGCPSESPPPDRKRRSSSFMSTHTIINGPIHIRRSTSDMASNDLSSYNPFATILLGMLATLVAMAILMGLVKLVRISTDINYQRVPIEGI